ncbi:MFS transporter [Streptomyces adustus]|uniref:MFS transporter n=1 Tax=Streptomyces adustus TaxID=1609272 RepID=UPI003714BD0A
MKRFGSPPALIAVLTIVGLLSSLVQTMVIPLIPEFPMLLGASATGASWVVTITLLVGAVVTPVSGRLGDIFGKRHAMLLTLAVVFVGSVISALAESLWAMVIGRGLQGCVIGVIPLVLGLFRDELEAARVRVAIALLSAVLGFGAVAGIPLAGLMAEHMQWHVLFWASGGFTLLCALLVALAVPESRPAAARRFDVVGTVGLTAGLIGLLLPVVNAEEWGWRSERTLGLGAAAVTVLLGWGRHQLRTAHPLVDLRLTAQRPVLMANLATIGIGFAVYTTLFVFPQVLQAPTATGYGFGQSLLRAGTAVVPNGLAALLLTRTAVRLVTRYGARTSMMIGAAVMAAGYAFIALRMTSVADFVIAATVIGAGAGIAIAATSSLITDMVPLTETASANGVNTLMRSAGGALASAVLASILTHTTVRVGAVAFPSRAGVRTAFATAAAAAIIGLILTVFVPSNRLVPRNGSANPVVGPKGRNPLAGGRPKGRHRRHAQASVSS